MSSPGKSAPLASSMISSAEQVGPEHGQTSRVVGVEAHRHQSQRHARTLETTRNPRARFSSSAPTRNESIHLRTRLAFRLRAVREKLDAIVECLGSDHLEADGCLASGEQTSTAIGEDGDDEESEFVE